MASSGDVLADRRFAWAEAAFADDDFDVAADLARQALDLSPDYAPAWLLLGRAIEGAGRDGREAALAAYGRARELDGVDVLGAGLHLARLGAADPAGAMSAAYVTRLFDEYAIRFDRHLRRSLAYRAPELLHDAVRRACSARLRPVRFAGALDLGCGTGLAAEAFRPVCGRIAGVDLSAAMVAKAEAKRLYDELATGDLVGWLRERADGSADLALAADVFVYVPDLGPAFAETARVLGPGGLFAFTVQAGTGDGVSLGDDHRFAHGPGYVRGLADRNGFAVAILEDASTRQDRGADVPGLLAVLEKGPG